MLGQMYRRGTVNMIAGADHVVTAAIMLVEAVGRAAGRDLLTGEQIAPHRTWLLSAQERQDELDRKIAAVCKPLSISTSDLGDRLVAQSVAGQLLHVATLNANGRPVIDEEAVQWFESGMVGKDVLALTPLIAFHRVNQHDDFGASVVAREVFGGIAARTQCAVELGNHLTKKDEVSGAPALLHATHVIRTVTTMTASEADKFVIAVRDRYRYVKVESRTGPIVIAEAWFRLDGDLDLVAVPWPKPALPLIAIGKTASRPSRASLPKTAQNVPKPAQRGRRRNQPLDA
jgi:hypothetical protein